MQQTDDKLTMFNTMATLAKPTSSQPRICACSSKCKKGDCLLDQVQYYIKQSAQALLLIITERGIAMCDCFGLELASEEAIAASRNGTLTPSGLLV